MTNLEANNPGDRENDARVARSLQQLPDQERDRVQRLAVVHGGGHWSTLAAVMAVELNDMQTLATLLVEVGLAEVQEHAYLRLDPALPAYLQREQPPERLAELTATWAAAMEQLVQSLYQQQFQNSRWAFGLTLLDLPNLTALLDWLGQQLEADRNLAEKVADIAGKVEQLLETLDRPQAQAQAVALRERAAAAVPEWGKTQFENQRLQIERLLGQGQLQAAYDQAQALLTRSRTVGPTAYPRAAYDLALAHWLLGQVLQTAGQAAPALELAIAAHQQFEALGERGATMVAPTLNAQADALQALGRLDEAAAKYEAAIALDENRGALRSKAVAQGQLATVRMLQGRYRDAIAGYEVAGTLFEQQNEPKAVATMWHQTGMVYQKIKQYDAAETAYRQSLKIKTRIGDRLGQAGSLTQLGNLYHYKLNRPEEAVTLTRQAANIYVEQGDVRNEGAARNNIADILRELQRYDEARREILRAIDCNQPFGHAAQPWTAFHILHGIETAIGNPSAARGAWQQARAAYLAYRQQGGYAKFGGGKMVDQVLGLIAQRQVADRQALCNELVQMANEPDTTASQQRLLQAMVAILNGSRDPALADDDALRYHDAAEVLLFIDRL
jgi:tetratricopeptide (TPR) repeat protein